MANGIALQLPWPPSVNQYWRNNRGTTILSKRGREYKKDVEGCVLCLPWSQINRCPLKQRLQVHLTAYPPDRRKRDIDNLLKGVLDSLEKAGVYENDEQIDDLHIVRGDVEKYGRILVVIEEIGATEC